MSHIDDTNNTGPIAAIDRINLMNYAFEQYPSSKEQDKRGRLWDAYFTLAGVLGEEETKREDFPTF